MPRPINQKGSKRRAKVVYSSGMELNPQQKQAVQNVEGPLLVLAGAGSGKTGVITQKIAHLIERCGYRPDEITALTFTNKAAREMQSRVGKLLPVSKIKGLRVSTFHSLGLRILQQEGERLGFKPGFSIFDAQDVMTLLKELAGANAKLPDEAQWLISTWKNDLLGPEQAHAQAQDENEMRIAQLYVDYQRHLKAYNAVDFDDLLRLPVELFRDHPEALAKWQSRIRYLLVDEYQDTNGAQYRLFGQLVGKAARFTVVGDDDQSIYAWRGAKPENLAQLGQDFPRLEVIKLEQNYRSSNRILRTANHLIKENPRHYEKSLWSELGSGEKIQVLPCGDSEEEARRIIDDIAVHRIRHRKSAGDYAILYRSNFQAQPFEKVLRERNIPYHISGGQSFFERAEVKDVIAYLRLLVNPDDDRAFLRVVNIPRREIGPSTLEKLGAYAQERQQSMLDAARGIRWANRLGERPLIRLERFVEWLEGWARAAESESANSVVRGLLEEAAYYDWLRETSRDEVQAKKRIEFVESLLGWIKRLSDDQGANKSLAEIVAHMGLLDLLENQDDGEKEANDKVQLMTLHAAKGLEFDQVFLVGIEEETLPHRNSLEADSLEEERRLMYVGITRARFGLTLSYAISRQLRGEKVDTCPSRFLEELPADELIWEGKQTLPPEELKELGESRLADIRAMLGKT